MISFSVNKRPVKVDVDPDYQKFDRALKTQVRPVLVPFERLPFRDFTAEERNLHEQVLNDRNTMMAHSDADANVSIPDAEQENARD